VAARNITIQGAASGGCARCRPISITDLGWSIGTGPEVRGSAEAIIMTVAGRTTALVELEAPDSPSSHRDSDRRRVSSMHMQVAGKLTGPVTKWIVFGFWIAVFMAGGMFAGKLADVQSNEAQSWLPESAESTRAFEKLTRSRTPTRSRPWWSTSGSPA
jgi:hypothetical protein